MPVHRSGDLAYETLAGRRSANPLAGSGAGSGGEAGTHPVSVRVVRVRPGARTPHVHPHSCEVVYVAEGEGRVWEDDDAATVTAGDLVVVPAGTPHATVCTGQGDLVLVCFFPHPDLSANLTELDGPVRE